MDARTQEPGPSLPLWGTLSGLMTFGLTFPLWATIGQAQSIYSQIAFGALPLPAEVAMLSGPLLWIPALTGFLLALALARRGRHRTAARLFFWMTLSTGCLHLLTIAALFYPLLHGS